MQLFYLYVNIKSLSSDNSLNLNTVVFLHTQTLLHILQDCFLVHYWSNQKVISRNQIWLKMLVSLHKRCFRVKEMRYCKSILLYNREAIIWSTFMHTNGRVCVFDIHTKHAQATYAKSIFQFQVFIRSEIPSSRNEWINVMIFSEQIFKCCFAISKAALGKIWLPSSNLLHAVNNKDRGKARLSNNVSSNFQ